MMRRALFILLCFAFFGISPAWAGKFPIKPITLVVPEEAGGQTDSVARFLAQHMGQTLHTFFKVENITGSGGTAAAKRVAASPPDGYTLLFHHFGFTMVPPPSRKLPYDALRDFEPIGAVGEIAMVLVARKDFPAADVYELISLISQNSNSVRMASAGIGTDSHLCGLLFSSATRTDLTVVPIEGTVLAMNSLYQGQVDLLCGHITDTIAAIKLGGLKAYGSTTGTRLAVLQDVPTLGEAGIPEFDAPLWQGLYAPKGTPHAVIDALASALQAALEDSRLRNFLAGLGTIPVPKEKAAPEAMRQLLRSDLEMWSPILKKAGIKPAH